MTTLSRQLGGTILLCVVSVAAACSSEAQRAKKADANVNPDALILKDFKDRVEQYMDLRDKLEKDTPPMKETKDPAKIKAAEDALGARVKEARANARQGDIFTPDIAAKFRRSMYPELKGPEGRETKSEMKEEEVGPVKFAVNATYPIDSALPTMPPNLLSTLPTLPDTLEYRIIGRHLILRDVHANIIVDFIPNAIR